MRRAFVTAAAAAALALGCAACGAEPLVGDWFPCEDQRCSRLDDEGLRFDAGGRFGALDAPGGSYEPGREAYVLRSYPRGRYTVDGDRLTLVFDGASTPVTMQIEVRSDGEIRIGGGSGAVERCYAEVGTRCAPETGTSAGRRYLRVMEDPPPVPLAAPADRGGERPDTSPPPSLPPAP